MSQLKMSESTKAQVLPWPFDRQKQPIFPIGAKVGGGAGGVKIHWEEQQIVQEEGVRMTNLWNIGIFCFPKYTDEYLLGYF